MTKTKKIKKSANDLITGMTKFEQARWLALYEAVNIIADKAEDAGERFDKITLKQPALEKYVESTCDGICKYLEQDEKREEKKGRKLKIERAR